MVSYLCARWLVGSSILQTAVGMAVAEAGAHHSHLSEGVEQRGSAARQAGYSTQISQPHSQA